MALPRGRAKLRARKRRIHQNALARREAAMNDPARVTAPLTPRTLGRELNASTRLRFGPEESALDSQFRANAERQRLIPGWFQNYLDSIKQAEAARIQQHAQAQAEITARSQAPDQYASGSAEGQQAQAARGASTAAFQNLLTTQNLARGTYYSQLGVAGQGAQVQALQQNAGLARGLESDRRDLARQKGDYRVQLRGQLRDKEHEKQLERAAFGLKEQDLALDAREDRSKARDRKAKLRDQRLRESRRQMEADRKYQLDVEKLGAQQAKDNYQRRNKLGPYRVPGTSGGKAKPRAKELQGSRNLKFKVDNAVSEIRTLSGTKKKDGGRLSSTEIRAILADEKVPRVVINAAYDLVAKGYLSGPNIAALRRAGVRIPRSWLRPRRRGRAPSSTDATGGY